MIGYSRGLFLVLCRRQRIVPNMDQPGYCGYSVFFFPPCALRLSFLLAKVGGQATGQIEKLLVWETWARAKEVNH